MAYTVKSVGSAVRLLGSNPSSVTYQLFNFGQNTDLSFLICKMG